MNRHFVSAMLVVIGIVLGLTIGSHPQGDSGMPAARASDLAASGNDEVVVQLKEINAQLKEIKQYMRTGAFKVIDLINADTAPQN